MAEARTKAKRYKIVYSAKVSSLRDDTLRLLIMDWEGDTDVATATRIGALLGPEKIRECADPVKADLYARAVISDGSQSAESAFFEENARFVLRAYLLAAGLSGSSAETVAEWVAALYDETALRVLQEHAEQVPAGWLGAFEEYVKGAPTDTHETIRYIVRTAVMAAE
ncbi:hypothetical protein [Kitasatospora sp. NPDC001527]|uniref:hypothetical protein n=1 Tax=Kitasatospora sp. NPDC001527 TaxID=3154519 RepID=UPI003327B974